MILIFGNIYSNINTFIDNELISGAQNTATQDSMQEISGSSALQAISAARAGGRVSIIGTVGNDLFGRNCLDIFRKEGINSSSIAKSKTGTGLEFSFSDPDNKATSIISYGANLHTHAEQIPEINLNERTLLMLSSDSDVQVINILLERAKARESRSILCLDNNNKLDASIYSSADIIVSNENIINCNSTGYIVEAINNGVYGAKLHNKEGNINNYESTPNEKIIDTKACFEVFCGFFASAIQAGLPIRRAITLASKAAQKTSEKIGIYDSIPYLGYVQDLEKEKARNINS